MASFQHGGADAVWSHNGRELFFRSGDNRILVVAYMVKGDSIVADQPRVWVGEQLASFGILGTGSYDLAPDAQQAQNKVTFLENFFDELRRKAPLGSK